MARFIVQRLIFVAIISVVIVFAAHLGMRMVGNSTAPEPNFDLVVHGRAAWAESKIFFSNLLRGDLGTFHTVIGTAEVELDVVDYLRESFVNSMGLLLAALAASAVIGIYLGSAIALTKNKFIALPVLTLTIIGISTPSFFAGMLFRSFEIWHLSRFDNIFLSAAGFGWDYRHMTYPVLVLAARPLAYLTRTSFIALENVMREDYIRTAFSKGLHERWVVIEHALKNMAVPVLTAVGVSLRFSLSTLPVVEFFFVWPGIGLRLVEAIRNQQTLVAVTLAFALGLVLQLVNAILDIIYRLVDPRLREEG
jgi:peptide/nickel transport system permease protein